MIDRSDIEMCSMRKAEQLSVEFCNKKSVKLFGYDFTPKDITTE